jgi:Rrf2 family nitric oxide-sensitive transcriptional repressor
MQLTQFTDYALRVLMHLAGRNGELSTIGAIAAAQAISENHLMKVVHRLARLGYVATLRGKGGGLRLALAPEQISIGALVRDVEEMLAPAECLDARSSCTCRLLPACRLRPMLRDAQQAFLQHLDGYHLCDLLQPHAPPAARQRPPRRGAARHG